MRRGWRAPAERLAKSPGAVGEVGVAEALRGGVKRQVCRAIGHRGPRFVAAARCIGNAAYSHSQARASALVAKRIVRPERPDVALRIARGELARAVVGVLQLTA